MNHERKSKVNLVQERIKYEKWLKQYDSLRRDHPDRALFETITDLVQNPTSYILLPSNGVPNEPDIIAYTYPQKLDQHVR